MPILRDFYIKRTGDFMEQMETDYPGADVIFTRLDNFFNKKIHFNNFLKEFTGVRLTEKSIPKVKKAIVNHIEEIIDEHKGHDLKEFDYLRYSICIIDEKIYLTLYIEHSDGTKKFFDEYKV